MDIDYNNFNKDDFTNFILNSLLEKSCLDGSLIDFYKLVELHKAKNYSLLSLPLWSIPFASTRKQLEDFYDFVKEPNISTIHTMETLKIFEKVLKHILKSGWLDLLDKIPSSLQAVFLKARHNIRSYEEIYLNPFQFRSFDNLT